MKIQSIGLGAALSLFGATILSAKLLMPPANFLKTMTTSDQRVTAPLIEGEGWKCKEKVDVKNLMRLVLCARVPEEENLYMFAQEFEVSTDEVLPAHTLAKQVLPNLFKNDFRHPTITAPVAVTHQSHPGYEFQIDGMTKQAKKKKAKELPIHKSIQVFAKGTHVFEIGVEGTPDLVRKYQSEIDRFTQGVQFRGLEADPSATDLQPIGDL